MVTKGIRGAITVENNSSKAIEDAVNAVLDEGFRTGDIMEEGKKYLGCKEMGDKIAEKI